MIKIEKEIKIEKDESWEANWSDESSESSEYKDDGEGSSDDAGMGRGKVIPAKARKGSTKGAQKIKVSVKVQKLNQNERQRSTRAKVAQSEELKQKVHEKGRQQKAQKATTWKEKVKQAELAKEKDVLTDADRALIEEVREHKLKQNEWQRSRRARLAQSEELKQKVLEKDRQQKAQKSAAWKEKVKQAELAKEKDVLTDADKALIEEVRERRLKQNEQKRLSRANLPEESKRKALEKDRQNKAMKRATGEMTERQQNAMRRLREAWKEKEKQAELAKEKDALTDADKALIEEVERRKFEKNMKNYLSKAARSAQMSEEAKLKERRLDVLRVAAKRSLETPDERKARLEKTRMQYQAKMANMTLEQLEHHRAVTRNIQARKKSRVVPYAEWSEEKKEKMRARLREKTKRETPEQREARLARYKRNIEKKKNLKSLMEGGASREEAENLLKQVKPELFEGSARTGRPIPPEPRPYRPMPHWRGEKAGRPKKVKQEEIEEYLADKKKWEENFSVKWIHEVNNTTERPTSSRSVDLQENSNSCSSVDDGSSQRTSSCSTSETRKDVAMASPKPMSTRISIDTGASIDDMPLFSLDEYSPPSSPLPEMESNINEVTKTVDVESETDSANNLATSGRKKVGKRKRIVLKANNSARFVGQDNRKTLPNENPVALESGNSTPEFLSESKKFAEDPIQDPVDFSMDYNTISPEDSPPSSPLPELETDMNDVTETANVEIDTVETPDPECENKTSASRKKSKMKPKQSEPTEYRCEQCSKTYKHKRFYDIHMIEFHGELSQKSLTCPVEGCLMVFALRVNLGKHYQRAHVDNDNAKPKPSTKENSTYSKGSSPICHICGKTFTIFDSLHKHMKYIHPLDSTKNISHICNYCGKCFKQKCTLDDHVRRIHQGMSNGCDLCGRSFQSAVKLWRHKVDSHGMTDLQPSAVGNIQVQLCTFCGEYIFRGMKAHVEKQHPEQLEEYIAANNIGYNKNPRARESDEFYCELCKKTVRRKSYRNLHNRINHPELIDGVLPETLPTCDICGEKACSEKKLVGHILQSHVKNLGITLWARLKENGDKEPLICQFCSASQEDRIMYRVHIINDHSQDLIAFVKTKVEEGSLLDSEQLKQIENQRKNKAKRLRTARQQKTREPKPRKQKTREPKSRKRKTRKSPNKQIVQDENEAIQITHSEDTPVRRSKRSSAGTGTGKRKSSRLPSTSLSKKPKISVRNSGRKSASSLLSAKDKNIMARFPNIEWGSPVVVVKSLTDDEIHSLSKGLKHDGGC